MNRALLVPAAAIPLWIVSCTQILGDDFVVGEGGHDGGSNSTTTTTTTTSTGIGGSGGGFGGAGGGGAPPCVVGDLGICGAGNKCSVVDNASGETGCVLAGPRPPFSRCDSDVNCEDGTFCDPPSGTCLPVCSVDANCSNGGVCVFPADENGELIVGVKVCTANCNVLTASPCDQSFGPVTCVPAEVPHCWKSEGFDVGAACTTAIDCAPGVVCLADETCYAWCTPPGAQAGCPAPTSCIDVGFEHESIAYGVCAS